MNCLLMSLKITFIRKFLVTYVTFILDPLVHSIYMFSHEGPVFKYLVTLLTFISKLFMYYLDMTSKAVPAGKLFIASVTVKRHPMMMH